ncbi:nuclear transport factor 2 family protein [Streptomyces sp. NPDC050617]|uniref:nuclear transport factor 2 family protein n=1 Tax=Streptomyces sp. NPDC050617 TaxID=3154628 RepID=UPI0034441303
MLDIQEISDRMEIQELLVAYAAAIDSKDFDSLDRIFTEDAHIDYTTFGAIAGTRAEMKEFLASSMAQFAACQHLIANPEIRFDGDGDGDGDRATGRVMCLNALGFPTEDGDPQIALLGMWYIDEYIRTPAGWRISRRGQERSWTKGFGDVPGNTH